MNHYSVVVVLFSLLRNIYDCHVDGSLFKFVLKCGIWHVFIGMNMKNRLFFAEEDVKY